MANIDYKNTQKDLYQPKIAPSIVNVPEMTFILIDGRGDPNISAEYAAALDVLYGLSYAVKMSKMDGSQPSGYFEYVVPPLEGLWSIDDGVFRGSGAAIADKGKLIWTAMIRQPEFVTVGVFESAKAALSKKKPKLDLSPARLEIFTEGLCAQVMHIGPYDDEPATIARLSQFIADNGYTEDISEACRTGLGRRHHEIYLGDPRKTAPEKLRTVIRHPIRRNEG